MRRFAVVAAGVILLVSGYVWGAPADAPRGRVETLVTQMADVIPRVEILEKEVAELKAKIAELEGKREGQSGEKKQ